MVAKDGNETRNLYTTLAQYYDKIYNFVDYAEQAEFFDILIRKYNNSNSRKILDAACGTGTHVFELAKKGYDIIGMDISSSMLEVAKKKYPKLIFRKSDMRELSAQRKVGIILCFFRAINYNRNLNELKQTLSGMYEKLEPGGILIFDAADKSIGIGYKKSTLTYKDKELESSFTPNWRYDPKENILHLEIEFIINGEKMSDHHIMGPFTFSEIVQIMEEIGFKVTVLERKFDKERKLNLKTPQDTTAIFIGQK